jgi:hypothetical protein
MSDFTLQACKFAFTYKNIRSSKISQCAGNFGHLTLKKKVLTRKAKPLFMVLLSLVEFLVWPLTLKNN